MRTELGNRGPEIRIVIMLVRANWSVVFVSAAIMWFIHLIQFPEFQQFLYTNELACRLAFLCRQNSIVYCDWLRAARVDYMAFCDQLEVERLRDDELVFQMHVTRYAELLPGEGMEWRNEYDGDISD